MKTIVRLVAVVVLLVLTLLVVVYIDKVTALPDLPPLKTTLAFGIGLLVAVGIGGIVTPLSRGILHRRIDKEFPKEACEER